MKKAGLQEMKRFFSITLVLVACGTVLPGMRALSQAPASNGPAQNPAPSSAPQPATNAPPAAQQESNPFPEDTTTVPVMPSATSAGSPPSAFDSGDSGSLSLPTVDSDPVRSPDDPDSGKSSGQDSSSSDSLQGLDQLLQPPPDTGKHKKKDGSDQLDEPFPHDSPQKDISVGSYYLDSGDWRGALSRFESAMVLDPENPDVYWGMAEAERHLGQYAEAKANYQKVVDYDPDSRHGKDAKKILKQPEIANAPAVSSNTSTTKPQP